MHALAIAQNILDNTNLDKLTAQDIAEAVGTDYGRISHLQLRDYETAIVRNDYQKFELSVSHRNAETVAYYGHELGEDWTLIRNAEELASLICEIVEWATLPEQMNDDLFFAHLEHIFPEEMDGVVYPQVAALLAEKLYEKLGEQEADQIFQEVLEKVAPQPADY